MTPNTSPVIKKQHVRAGPARPIGAPAPTRAEGPPKTGAKPEARIARMEANRAILEVRCACGNVIAVECQWDTPPDPGQPGPADADAPAEPNKEATS